MKSKSTGLKKTVPAKNASLGRVINQNEKIKETVKEAANELTSVNEVLKQGKEIFEEKVALFLYYSSFAGKRGRSGGWRRNDI